MSLTDFIFRNKAYRKKLSAHTEKDPSNLIAGSAEDRVFGLDAVLMATVGKTVLDVGCHDGTVSEAFAKAGAVRVDGCDIFERGVAMASERVGKILPASEFHVADLSKGPAVFAALPFLPKYDIVCYLGVHHHVKGQMTRSRLELLTSAIVDRSAETLLVRTPAKHFDELHDMIVSAGMVPDGDFVRGDNPKVGPLRVYRRAL